MKPASEPRTLPEDILVETVGHTLRWPVPVTGSANPQDRQILVLLSPVSEDQSKGYITRQIPAETKMPCGSQSK